MTAAGEAHGQRGLWQRVRGVEGGRWGVWGCLRFVPPGPGFVGSPSVLWMNLVGTVMSFSSCALFPDSRAVAEPLQTGLAAEPTKPPGGVRRCRHGRLIGSRGPFRGGAALLLHALNVDFPLVRSGSSVRLLVFAVANLLNGLGKNILSCASLY